MKNRVVFRVGILIAFASVAVGDGGDNAVDASRLPKVLIIGDSISIGYTPIVCSQRIAETLDEQNLIV